MYSHLQTKYPQEAKIWCPPQLPALKINIGPYGQLSDARHGLNIPTWLMMFIERVQILIRMSIIFMQDQLGQSSNTSFWAPNPQAPSCGSSRARHLPSSCVFWKKFKKHAANKTGKKTSLFFFDFLGFLVEKFLEVPVMLVVLLSCWWPLPLLRSTGVTPLKCRNWGPLNTLWTEVDMRI